MLLAQWFDGGVQPWLFLSQLDGVSVGFTAFSVLCFVIAVFAVVCK